MKISERLLKKVVHKYWLIIACVGTIILLSLTFIPFSRFSEKNTVFKPAAIPAKFQTITTSTPTPTATPTATVNSNPKSVARIPILMYHHIRVYNNPSDQIGTGLSVTPDNFKTQMNYLKNNGYTTITFADFVAFPQKSLPAKPVIVTFDDGYQDCYDNAYQTLKSNGQVGVFFIITDFLNHPDQMTSAEVKEISDSGMEIGSHTLSHPDLTKISIDDAVLQITQSKTYLENLIGKQVLSFCYPSGGNNPAVDSAVENAGYLVATTTVPGISNTKENHFVLPRQRVSPTTSLNGFIREVTIKK